MVGIRGKVRLVSPSGETKTVVVPGRYRRAGQLVLDDRTDWQKNAGWAARHERQFNRLLSQGWKIVTKKDGSLPKVGEEDKKNTDVVMVATKTGKTSHGGDHASGEVKDSPNRQQGNGQRPRGNRGGRPTTQERVERQTRKPVRPYVRPDLRRQGNGARGGGSVYAPQPLRVNKAIRQSAAKSAAMLAELAGQRGSRTPRSITINSQELLMALEIGDNPLPPLEDRDERPRLKVLISVDVSGSCTGWSGLGQAWALHIAQALEADVIYTQNFNGQIMSEIGPASDKEAIAMIAQADVLIYLGDSDGEQLCHWYAEAGATVLALDSFSANSRKPRLREYQQYPAGGGRLFWVDRVSSSYPETWEAALRLVLTSQNY